jgi:transcriptional regulator with XRE-family HTH domain
MEKIDEIFHTIGGNIIRLRTGGGMSQEQLAKTTGVGRSTIQSMESGDPCTLTNLVKIADALGVSPADLFLTNKDRDEITYKAKLLCDKLGAILNLK